MGRSFTWKPRSRVRTRCLSRGPWRLKVSHAFEAEYNLDGATLMVYPTEKIRRGHFSFNVFSSGSSTIKNLPAQHQPMAQAVLRALNVVDADEPVPTAAPEPDEAMLA